MEGDPMPDQEKALIVGVGEGLSLALARLFKQEGMEVALAARSSDRVTALAAATGCLGYRCDATSTEDVDALFRSVVADLGVPDIVVYNPSARVRGPVVDLDRDAVKDAILVTCYGGFLVA